MKDLNEKSTLAIMTQVSYDMEQIEGYVPGETPVAFAGIPQIEEPAAKLNYKPTGLNSGTIAEYHNYEDYFEYFLQKPLKLYNVNNSKYYSTPGELFEKSELNDAFYPNDGYIEWAGNVLVVKISEQ